MRIYLIGGFHQAKNSMHVFEDFYNDENDKRMLEDIIFFGNSIFSSGRQRNKQSCRLNKSCIPQRKILSLSSV